MQKHWENFLFGLFFVLGGIVSLFVARMIAAMFSQAHFPW